MKKRKPEKQENSNGATKQQTVLIFDQCGEQPICFIVVDGDHRKYNGCYINTDNDGGLGTFLYTNNGEFKHKKLKKFPRKAVKRGAYVIVCGSAGTTYTSDLLSYAEILHALYVPRR